MARAVEIPGGSVTLRDADEYRERDRRRLEDVLFRALPAFEKIRAAQAQSGEDDDMSLVDMREMGLTDGERAAIYEFSDATILASLESWTLTDKDGNPLALPRSTDDLGDLSSAAYVALRDATRMAGADAVTDFATSPDPESPTGGSGGSVRPSKVARASKSTKRSPRTGGSTATAA